MPQRPVYDFTGISPAQKGPATGTAGAPQGETAMQQALRLIEEASTGVAKGAGETGTSAMGMIPGFTDVTNKIGNSDLVTKIMGALSGNDVGDLSDTGSASQSAVKSELQAKTPAEKVGKIGEQVGEFMLPVGAMEKGGKMAMNAIAPIARLPLKSNVVVPAMNAARMAGRAGGNAIQSAVTAALHGDEHPERAAAIGAAGPLAAPIVAKTLPAIAQVAPFMGGALAWHAVPSFGGFATSMGIAAYVRKVLSDYLQDPTRLADAAQRAYSAVPTLARGTAGAVSEATKPERPEQRSYR